MLEVQMMKPFIITQENNMMKLTFEFEYFSIKKGEDIFQFIPAEGKEIIININSFQVENLGDVFVFRKGNRFIRLPLYQLLLISDIHNHLQTILQRVNLEWEDPDQIESEETLLLIELLEMNNLYRLIDKALENNNRELFIKLTNTKLKKGKE